MAICRKFCYGYTAFNPVNPLKIMAKCLDENVGESSGFFSRLVRNPFWELAPQPGTAITPAIIDIISSVNCLRKHALCARPDGTLTPIKHERILFITHRNS